MLQVSLTVPEAPAISKRADHGAAVAPIPRKNAHKLKKHLPGGPKLEHFEIERVHDTGRDVEIGQRTCVPEVADFPYAPSSPSLANPAGFRSRLRVNPHINAPAARLGATRPRSPTI